MRGGRGDRGQATVEFALVLPLLVIVIAGVIWVGQLMSTQVQLENAAREGARAAAVEPASASSLASAAVTRVVDGATVSTSVESTYVVVEVRMDVPGVPLVGVGARTLSADAVMRREDIVE